MRWWRRNLWGLLVLLPVLAATIGLRVESLHEDYWKPKPREPIAAAPDGWTGYGGARFRMTELAEARDVKGRDGKVMTLPGGAKIWRATIEVQTTDPKAIGGCSFTLEDAERHTYGDNPTELSRADVPLGSCLFEDPKTPPSTYETIVHFVMPGSARPAAVRVTLATKLPRYARLTSS